MFGIDAPTPTPVPEPEDATALRRADEVRRRRARGGRATTVNPSRQFDQKAAPQPAAQGFNRSPGAFGAGLGVYRD